MSKRNKIHGRTRFLLWWPLFLIPVIAALVIVVAFVDGWELYATLIFTGAYILFCAWWVSFWRSKLSETMLYFAEEFQEIQTQQLEHTPIPAALVEKNGNILWSNEAFAKICNEEKPTDISEMSPIVFDKIGAFMRGSEIEKDYFRAQINGREYHVKLRYSGDYATAWFLDETDYYEKVTIIENMRPIVAQVCFDNYDDVSTHEEEVKNTLMVALVERKISQYFKSFGAVVYAIEKDKYVANFDNKALREMIADKFSIVEDIKTLEVDDEKIGATISIGIGADGEGIVENASFSKMAMSLCLGRGGDQVVIRRPKGSSFYGGKTEKTEKKTRVKARVAARSIKDILKTKEKVVIMGHDMPDADSFGAAVGVYRIAKILGKDARIILENVPSSIKNIYNNVLNSIPAGEKVFVKKSEAKEFCTPETALFVVDVNRPSITECPEIISKVSTKIIIDHHRQGDETFDDATYLYIEPYASSASELVSEIIQYISDDVELPQAEAEALYAGIIIDTDNFLAKTGSRTFEAAAFLRRKGADMALVRKLFRESMTSFKAKSQVVSTVDIFREAYAFGKCEAEGLDSPTIVGAQAANELLDIEGVKASFVFTPYNGKIYASARSIDEVNVQLVMEKLGGGGHLSVAGAQFEDIDIEGAIAKTKGVLGTMINEGEI